MTDSKENQFKNVTPLPAGLAQKRNSIPNIGSINNLFTGLSQNNNNINQSESRRYTLCKKCTQGK